MIHDLNIMVLRITVVVSLQLWTATLLHDVGWPKMLTKAYFFGSFLNHNIFLAIHELPHNLAFWTPVSNRWLGVFANLPFGVPMSVTFQKYHLEHHRCQGVDDIDMDIPNHTETYLVTNVASKSIWVMLQLFFYALQPLFLKPKPPGYRSSLIFLSDNPSCCHDLFLGLEIFCLFDPFHIRRWWYASNGWSSQNIMSSIQTKKHILPMAPLIF